MQVLFGTVSGDYASITAFTVYEWQSLERVNAQPLRALCTPAHATRNDAVQGFVGPGTLVYATQPHPFDSFEYLQRS